MHLAHPHSTGPLSRLGGGPWDSQIHAFSRGRPSPSHPTPTTTPSIALPRHRCARGRPLPHRTAPDPPNLPRTNTICAAPSRAASTPAALVCLQSVSAGSSPLLSPRERRPRGVIRMRVDPHDLELSSRRWLGSSKARVRQDGQTRIWAESFDPGTCREVVGRAGDSHWAQSCPAARSASTTLRACARLSTPHSNWAKNAGSVRRL